MIAGRIANRLDLGGANYTVDAACGASMAAALGRVRRAHLGVERHGAVRRRRPAQRHLRLPAVLRHARAVAHRPVPHVRLVGRRHRARRGRGLRRAQAPRRRRARRRPHLRRHRRRVGVERRPQPRPHRAAPGGPAAGARAGVRPVRRVAGRRRPRRGARHRHRRRRPHRAVDADRRLLRAGRVTGLDDPRLGEVADRPHQVRRGHRRPDQGGPRPPPRRAAAHAQRHRPERGVRPQDQPVRVRRGGPAVGRARPAGGRQRLRVRRDQLPRRALGLPRRRRAVARPRPVAGRAVPGAGRLGVRCRRRARPPVRPARRQRRRRSPVAAPRPRPHRPRPSAARPRAGRARGRRPRRPGRQGRPRQGRRGRAGRVPRRADRPADGPAPEVAFLFPGQGSQRPHMLGDLFVAFPALRRYLELADGDLVERMFPPARVRRGGRPGRRRAHRHPRRPARARTRRPGHDRAARAVRGGAGVGGGPQLRRAARAGDRRGARRPRPRWRSVGPGARRSSTRRPARTPGPWPPSAARSTT